MKVYSHESSKPTRRYRFFLSIGLPFLGCAACLVLPANVNADTKAGEETFKTNCAMCHGSDGSGNTDVGKALQADDLRTSDVQKLTTADLVKIVQEGKNNKMPPFKDKLTSEQAKDVVSYVRTLARKPK